MTVAYATVLDVGYLVRGVSLYRSLLRHPAGKLFLFYCVDDEAADILEALSLPQAQVIRRAAYETPPLLALRKERSRSEYCWTLKPIILEHALETIPGLSWAIYLDSDMMAFGDPDVVLGESEIVLAPHRFTRPSLLAEEPVVGRFNAGYAAFRASAVGRQALGWWRDRCIELCPRVPTRGIYSDQTYLNSLPVMWPGAVRDGPLGLNAAPWNTVDASVANQGKVPLVDGEELLLFHFQSLRILGGGFFETYAGEFKLPTDLVDAVYRPYVASLQAAFTLLGTVRPGFAQGVEQWQRHPLRILRMTRRIMFGPNNFIRDAARDALAS